MAENGNEDDTAILIRDRFQKSNSSGTAFFSLDHPAPIQKSLRQDKHAFSPFHYRPVDMGEIEFRRILGTLSWTFIPLCSLTQCQSSWVRGVSRLFAYSFHPP
ncbi:hypothetical protein GWI33_008737 [Rhynchophorus ferrugineus]|uniref:Uncharacterized protein n=1 Tax=Rhynchophorus ferrugineus TaxID=354439 RepID=A0A834IG93_RHYFE|nr:hypothetical protein GWI33_008737 [Rhynchophorus ferrugineus]